MGAKQNSNLIDLSELAKKFGYTRDHLAFLCRTGEVKGEKAGRSWMASEQALQAYQKRVEVTQNQRWEEASKQQRLPEPQPKPVAIRVAAQSPALAQRSDRIANDRTRRTWDKVTARLMHRAVHLGMAGFDVAAGQPMKAVLRLTHSVAQGIYSVRSTPAKFAKSFEFAVKPVPELYKKYGRGKSVYRVTRQARQMRQAYATGLSLIAGLTLMHSTLVFSGNETKAKKEIAGFSHNVQLSISKFQSSLNLAFLKRQTEDSAPQIPKTEIVFNFSLPTTTSLLIQDYQQARVDRGMIAGTQISFGQPAGGTQLEISDSVGFNFADSTLSSSPPISQSETGGEIKVVEKVVLRDVQVVERAVPGPRGERGEKGETGAGDQTGPTWEEINELFDSKLLDLKGKVAGAITAPVGTVVATIPVPVYTTGT